MAAHLPIERLGEEMLPQILDIERQCYAFPWSERIFRSCLEHEDYQCWGLRCDEDLIAFAVIHRILDEHHLLNLCVRPGAQGQGVARVMLRHVLAVALAQQAACVTLEVRESNDRARNLYASEGFSETGRRPDYYRDGRGREAAVIMHHWFLAPAAG